VVLGPPNPLTNQLNNIFRKFYDSVLFVEDDKEIKRLVEREDYLERFPNGIRKQFCLGILVDEYRVDQMQLRYRIFLNYTSGDLHRPSEGAKVFFKAASLWQYIHILRDGVVNL